MRAYTHIHIHIYVQRAAAAGAALCIGGQRPCSGERGSRSEAEQVMTWKHWVEADYGHFMAC